MTKVKHVLGISGGKDSAALAIYLRDKYPMLDIEYYSCDTGNELDETYELIQNLEVYLGKSIKVLSAADGSPANSPFDHFLELYGGYLPSSMSRWCTKKLKLEPFENYIAGDEQIISYVGIRGDENREGYISTKSNIQSIFPFRKNIWSEDVIRKVMDNTQIPFVEKLYSEYAQSGKVDRIIEVVQQPISPTFQRDRKLDILLDLSIEDFNRVVFAFLKTTEYPLAKVDDFPLVNNADILVRDDIFRILEQSGVGVPAYYKKREYQVEIDGELRTGYYSRSRSGCYFCFFQQKIEWVWLYENHRALFNKATTYEDEGYTWMQNETLKELSQPQRRDQIKREHLLKMERAAKNQKSDYLVDILEDAEGEGCISCFL